MTVKLGLKGAQKTSLELIGRGAVSIDDVCHGSGFDHQGLVGVAEPVLVDDDLGLPSWTQSTIFEFGGPLLLVRQWRNCSRIFGNMTHPVTTVFSGCVRNISGQIS